MRVVIAPDSFKESLSAPDVTDAIARGLSRAIPTATIDRAPMADGGEGTVEALVDATRGRVETMCVTGPLGQPVTARYGLLGDGATAAVEMAAASGLPLVPVEERDPSRTTTYGTGELIAAAFDRGARKILVGIGGSATNDGGAGMAQALGVKLLDQQGQAIGPGGAELLRLARIERDASARRFAEVEVEVACDVDNPLLGERGAARVYAPQKGADAQMVELLEQALANFADVVKRDLGVDVTGLPGAGAAGGLGAGLVAFLNAKLRLGIEIVIEATRLPERVRDADLVITGEGQIDGQSAYGKTAVGVAKVAAAAGVPVVAIAGSLGHGHEAVLEHGIQAYFSIMDRPMARDEAFANAASLVETCAEHIGRLASLGFRGRG